MSNTMYDFPVIASTLAGSIAYLGISAASIVAGAYGFYCAHSRDSRILGALYSAAMSVLGCLFVFAGYHSVILGCFWMMFAQVYVFAGLAAVWGTWTRRANESWGLLLNELLK